MALVLQRDMVAPLSTCLLDQACLAYLVLMPMHLARQLYVTIARRLHFIVEVKNYKIRCNSLHTGAVLISMWNLMLGTEKEARKQMIAVAAAGVPLATMGETSDVANVVLYLGSDESK